MSEPQAAGLIERAPLELPVAGAMPQSVDSRPAAVAITTAPSAPPSLQARADLMLVRALPVLRYRMRGLGISGVAGLVAIALALGAAIILIIPAHRSIESLSAQLLAASKTTLLPASQSFTPRQFANSLPSRAQVPALLNTVLEQATAAGVVLEQGKYTFTPSTGTRLSRYSFEFPIKADYGHVRSFINRTLTAIPALGLDKLHIERKNIGDATVSADVGFVVYLRGS